MYKGCIIICSTQQKTCHAHAVFQFRPESSGSSVKAATPSEEASASEEAQEWHCPDTTCQCVFASQHHMEQHVLIGQHSRQKGWQSSFDVTRKKWAQKCLSVHTAGHQLPSAAPDASSASSAPMSSAGWALKQQAKARCFSQQVRSYLEELFKVGQQSGIKADHAQVARGMRQAVDDDGTRVFPPEDWLTAKQVQSYFSRLASANKQLSADEEEEEAEEQQEAV